jgi:hypothetical protein
MSDDAAMRTVFRLLGPLEVTVGGVPVALGPPVALGADSLDGVVKVEDVDEMQPPPALDALD